jgi:aspartate aminotransferase
VERSLPHFRAAIERAGQDRPEDADIKLPTGLIPVIPANPRKLP